MPVNVVLAFFFNAFYSPGFAWWAASVRVPSDTHFLVLMPLCNPSRVWAEPSDLLLMNRIWQ